MKTPDFWGFWQPLEYNKKDVYALIRSGYDVWVTWPIQLSIMCLVLCIQYYVSSN